MGCVQDGKPLRVGIGQSGKNGKVCRFTPGGAEGDRTPDLVIANDALSHLSYGPVQVH